MFEEDFIISLLNKCNDEDKKVQYIKRKINKYGINKVSINEYNYIRQQNKLEQLNIQKLRNCLYENMISYSELLKYTGISRSMICMILRGNRNCTILQINKILNYLNKLNINFGW